MTFPNECVMKMRSDITPGVPWYREFTIAILVRSEPKVRSDEFSDSLIIPYEAETSGWSEWLKSGKIQKEKRGDDLYLTFKQKGVAIRLKNAFLYAAKLCQDKQKLPSYSNQQDPFR